MKKIANIFLTSLIITSCVSNPDIESQTLDYTISEKQDISHLNTPRIVYRIILNVDSIPTVNEMKNTAISIWEKDNKNWKEFTTFLYLPKMNTSMMAYGIGEFNQDGLVKFDLNEHSLSGTKWEIKETKQIEKEVTTPEVKEYEIDLSAAIISAREIKIIIRTDFPDGTNFLLSVGRSHFLKGSNEEYSGELFSKDFSVNQGTIETTVKIDDTKWHDEHQRLLRALPDDIQPIARISDDISISVLYSAARTQPSDVKNILGARGEFVTGKGADKFGTGTAGPITIFRVSKELNFPFQK
jgi:hypothetical protein